MRFYKFNPSDFIYEDGLLPMTIDPKTLWTQKHPEIFPININRANYWDLLKVPGLGPGSVKKIIDLRRKQKIRSITNLNNLRIQTQKILQYLRFD